MNKEFFEAVKALEKEKGVPAEYLYEKIKAAIVVAVKKDYNGKDVISCEINPEKNEMFVYLHKTVVDTVEDADCEISVEDAAQYKADAAVHFARDKGFRQNCRADRKACYPSGNS